ncbi:MAG: hypothetical protein PV358_12180 [Acidimicrobiales bacterium]|nr:hypothetical protein [Acidimicrobiales bacterium]
MLRTDDSVRRVRAMWLGSGALRWPWDWTFVEWGLAAGCCAVVIPLVGLTATLLLGPLAGLVMGPIGGGMIAREAFHTLRTAVDYDRPVRWWRGMIRHELQAGRPAQRERQTMRIVATWAEPVDARRRTQLAPRLADRWRGRRARHELARGVTVELTGGGR